jgi:DNA-binding FrmR family transcriptional regulator
MQAHLGMEAHLGTDELTGILNRLRRVEGQTRGLQRMLEENRSCEEIFTQLAATRAALDRVGVLLVSLMMRDCFEGESEDGTASTSEAVERAVEAFLRYSQFVK